MNTYIIVIANLLAIAALIYIFDHLYRDFRIDQLRVSLIAARDRLFEAAERGVISFDDPAYVMTRQTLNGMIRFAHQLSLWRILSIVFAAKYFDKQAEFQSHWSAYVAARESLDSRAKAAINATMIGVHVRILSHVLHTSILTFPFVLIAKITVRAFWKMQRLNKLVDSKVPDSLRQGLDSEAYSIGDGVLC